MSQFEPTLEQGSVLLHPARLGDWITAALLNKSLLENATYFGLTVREVRQEIGIPHGSPVLLTGHQPVLFHPGLYAKLIVSSVLGERMGSPVFHKVTDTDAPREWEFKYPDRFDEQEQNPFFDDSDIPFADQKAPDESTIKRILERFANSGADSVKEAVLFHQGSLLQIAKTTSRWNDFHVRSIEDLDDSFNMKRQFLLASRICESKAYQRYSVVWLEKLDVLGEHYNQSLSQYRQAYHVRNHAVPFPDLKVQGEWREAPFWAAPEGKKRQTLWVRKEGTGRSVLRVENEPASGEICRKDGTPQIKAPFRIWPKALPQSLFARLFLCDYFIHGLGGGRYEKVNDSMCRSYLDIQPPAYGVASATCYIDPAASGRAEEEINRIDSTLQWERLLAQNPEYVVTRTQQWKTQCSSTMTAWLQELMKVPDYLEAVKEKTRLLHEIQQPGKRQEAGNHIKEINGKLRSYLTQLAPDFERLRREKDSAETKRRALAWREYPYLCHSREVLRKLKERILDS